jgi:hypothetical protein
MLPDRWSFFLGNLSQGIEDLHQRRASAQVGYTPLFKLILIVYCV